MFCFIYKWMISRALDSYSGGPGEKLRLPGVVTRHMRRCSSCGEFARLSGSFVHRLVQDGPGFLGGSNEPLDEKIISALAAEPRPVRRPRRKWLPRLSVPVPALAAALAVIVVAMGIILRVVPTAPGISENPINDLGKSLPKLEEILGSVESPIEKEMRSVGESIESAGEFLLACLKPEF